MRKPILAVITALLIACSIPVLAAPAQRGILVREAVLYVTPDSNSPKLATAGLGREVAVIEKSRNWVKVFANIDQKQDSQAFSEDISQRQDITGWILDKGIVLTSTPNGDAILFGEAADVEDQASRLHGRKGAAQDAMRLYARLAEYFPKSPLAGEALYRSADIRWQIEYADTMSLPSAKEQDPLLRHQINEEFMRPVIKKFPHTQWADLAAYHLLDNKICGDWLGRSKCPERESKLYEDYVHDHPQSPRAPEALYNAAWRQAALIEIYKMEEEAGHSSEAKNRASALSQRVITAYPDTDWARRAQALAFQVEQNIPTYGNAKE